MIRNRLGLVARTVVPAAVLLFLGASAGNAAPLSPAGQIDRAAAGTGALVLQVGEGNQLRLERQIRRQDLQGGRSGFRRDGRRYRRDGRKHRSYSRRHRYNDGVFFGFYPFTLNDYPPYYYAHPSRPRYSRGGCGYWSSRCAENWGYGNSNYYGCLRYHGC
jgi:hypothetical protein